MTRANIKHDNECVFEWFCIRRGSHVLQLNNVSVVYAGGVQALQPTDLRVSEGEFSVVLGASGAGKSTLLRCINGLVPTATGHIRADAIGMIESAPEWRAHRRKTAMVFQQHQLIGRLTALQNVLTGRLGYYSAWRSLFPLPTEEREFALHCLDRVGLGGEALRRADQLSGGQQQRVGIARALAQEPDFILADEPVASLDPATARKVLHLLHGICRKDGIAALVSLHQVDLAHEFADRIIGIYGGKTVYDGPAIALSEDVLAKIYRNGAAAQARETPVIPIRKNAKGKEAVA